ncbi:MAG: DUF2341 domain-containing protein [Dehalococcoidales bacterium]|jgi:PKD repeat protein
MAFTSWLYKQTHNITSATTITNYQVKFAVYKTSGTSVDATIYCNNHCNDDFSDIRFSVDGVTSLPYWIESYTSGVSAVVWVKFPTIDTTTVSIYYGNVSAVNESSGTNTFVLFDDFSSPTLNTTLWTTPTTYAITGGVISIQEDVNGLYSQNTIDLSTHVVRAKHKVSSISVNNQVLFGFNNTKNSHAYGTYQATFQFYSSSAQLMTIHQGTALTNTDIPNVNNDTNYYISEIRKSGTTVYLTSIDSIGNVGSCSSSSNTDSTNNNYIEFNGKSTQIDYIDFVLVRLYASIEPTHSTYGPEEIINLTTILLTTTPSSGNTPLTASINVVLPTILTGFTLNYGDGETYTNASQESFTISHTYDRFGTFEIYASGYNGSVFLEQYASVIVSNQTLTASFTKSQNNNIITFTDTSTGSPNEWYWTFGDGTHSYEQNPIHKYVAIGTYTITLYASNQQFNGYITSTVTISSIVYEHAPLANFKPAILNVITDDIPYTVQFTNLSYPTTGCTYLWNFGDSSTSTSLNPSHAYSSLGVYDVTLTTTNSYGYSTITYNDCIRIHNEAKIFKEKLNVTDLYSTFEIKVFNEFSTYGDKFYKAKIFTEISGHLQGEFPSSPGLDEYCNLSFYENINEYCETIYTSVTDYLKRTVISPIMSTLGFQKMKMKIWEENAHYDDSFNRE